MNQMFHTCNNVLEDHAASLKMEAARSSEMFVPYITQCDNPQDNLKLHCCENLKYHTDQLHGDYTLLQIKCY
jgi:hypothetical protein